MSSSTLIDVPDVFAASYGTQGPEARAWLVELPRIGGEFLDRWRLRPDGPPAHGMASLVLPVLREDGTPAVLKLQQLREETAHTATGLLAWRGEGVVRLLDHDERSATQLLERLDAARTLSSLDDDDTAMAALAGLLARLTAVAAPIGVRKLSGIAAAMLERTPEAVTRLGDPAERRLVEVCASAVAELIGESGDRLLHWDLHYENVLAAEREPWLAIDPKPLAGDPGFELLPALYNRFDPAAVQWRFDLLTEALGLDRERARAWSLGRVLQNTLWHIEDGERHLEREQESMARTLLAR